MFLSDLKRNQGYVLRQTAWPPAESPVTASWKRTGTISIRPVAIGRRAYFFFGAASGGRAAATALSLIETCKLNNVEPYAYLKDVLSRIGSHRQDQLAELLPFNWKPLPVSIG